MKPTSKVVETDPADFAPGGIAHNAARKHFEANSMVPSNRNFLIAVLSIAINVVQGISIASMIPLQRVQVMQPQKVEGGRVIADPTVVAAFTPDQEMMGYFVNQWAKSIKEIAGLEMLEKSKRYSIEMVVGPAKDQLREQISRDNPYVLLAEAPALSRDYEYKSINFLNSNTAFLRFTTITRRPGMPARTQYYALTAQTTRIPPKTREEYMRNPTGLYITNFSLSEETSEK